MDTSRAPMGWNSWDCYGAAVTEDIVRQNAAYMAKKLRSFGYSYVVVDIQWAAPLARNNEYLPFTELEMDQYSRLLPAVNRFPSAAGGQGFGPLAEEIHRMGLKFGIHIMRGIPRQAVHRNTGIWGTRRTARDIAAVDSICSWNTDMYGVDPRKEGAKAYYQSLFALYASWGVDFIKCDDICRELPKAEAELLLIADALRGCGREMVLSLAGGPALPEKAELYKRLADMWRIADDFWHDLRLLYDMFDRAAAWCIHGGNGHWPDADMLPVGPIRQTYDPHDRTRFTRDEQITMMTLWCILRSPLIIGGEMTGFDPFTLSLLTNRSILNMHRLARHSHPVWRKTTDETEWILWTAACADGGTYGALFNVGEADAKIVLPLQELELRGPLACTDLWSGVSGVVRDALPLSVKRHGAAAFLLKQ